MVQLLPYQYLQLYLFTTSGFALLDVAPWHEPTARREPHDAPALAPMMTTMMHMRRSPASLLAHRTQERREGLQALRCAAPLRSGYHALQRANRAPAIRAVTLLSPSDAPR